jgi:hypothetical protein
MKLEFSWKIFERVSHIIFIKIRPMGAELFHVDGQTVGQKSMTKLIVAFRNCADAPKKKFG